MKHHEVGQSLSSALGNQENKVDAEGRRVFLQEQEGDEAQMEAWEADLTKQRFIHDPDLKCGLRNGSAAF